MRILEGYSRRLSTIVVPREYLNGRKSRKFRWQLLSRYTTISRIHEGCEQLSLSSSFHEDPSRFPNSSHSISTSLHYNISLIFKNLSNAYRLPRSQFPTIPRITAHNASSFGTTDGTMPVGLTSPRLLEMVNIV